MTTTECEWCDEVVELVATVDNPRYGTVCASHVELSEANYYGDPDAAYEVAQDALLGVG
jgi:hypothetical protein